MTDYLNFTPSKRKHKAGSNYYTDKRRVYWYEKSGSLYCVYKTRKLDFSGKPFYEIMATKETEDEAKKLVDLLIWGV